MKEVKLRYECGYCGRTITRYAKQTNNGLILRIVKCDCGNFLPKRDFK